MLIYTHLSNSLLLIGLLLCFMLSSSLVLAQSTNCLTSCPNIELISLQEIAGFPQANRIVTCADPDTLSILLFNEGTIPLSNVQLQIDFAPGIDYGGTVNTLYPEDNISELNISNLEHPVFLIEELDTNATFIALISLKSNCKLNTDLGPVSINASLTYNINNCNGGLIECVQTYDNIADFSSEFREPVINLLEVSPVNQTINTFDTDACQTLVVSQNGIDAFVNEFEYRIIGIPNNPDFSISDFSTNVGPVPYTYDSATESLHAIIDNSHFSGAINGNGDDKLDEDEQISLSICYQISDCLATPSYDFLHQAYFGCSDQTCGEVSQKEASLNFAPNFGATANVNASLSQALEICTANAIVDISLNSANTDPYQGLYTDLITGFQLCENNSIEVVDVQINNTSIPANSYYYENADFFIDFTNITTDLDGAGGLSDFDNDGFFDDLEGGQSLNLKLFIDITCGEAECQNLDCTFSQATIMGKRHCGQSFQNLPNINPPIHLFYGPEQISTNESPIPSTSISGYDFGQVSDSPDEQQINVQFCYEFDSENVNTCSDANTYLEVILQGPKHMIKDVQFVPNSASWAGSMVADNQVDYQTDYDNNTALLRINAGNDLNNTLQCYEFSLEMDSCVCAPPNYIVMEANVVEDCTDSPNCDCTFIRSCTSLTARADHFCSPCECDVQSTVEQVHRTNYGYSDHTLSTQLNETTADFEDLNRYLPCDTMFLELSFEVLNAAPFQEADYQWSFRALFRAPSYQANHREDLLLYPNLGNVILEEFAYQKGGMGNRIAFDFENNASCLEGRGATFLGISDESSPHTFNRTYYNSSNDQYDNTGILFLIYNYDNRYNGQHNNNAGDCLDYFKNQIDVADGDVFWLSMKIPLQKNPKLNITGDDPIQSCIIYPQANAYSWDTNRNALSGQLLQNCRTNAPIETYDPGHVIAESRIGLNNCDATIEHVFKLSKPTPLEWYQNEYRPIIYLDDIHSPMPSPLVYEGNAIATHYLGNTTAIEKDGTINQNCTYYAGDYYCQSTNEDLSYNIFNQEEALRLGVGLNNDDSLKISYTVKQLCPDQISNIPNYDLRYTHGNICDFDPEGYRCNINDNNGNHYPEACNNQGQNYAESVGNIHQYRDTAYTLLFTDNSADYPSLSASMLKSLIADEAGTSEFNEYQLCAGAGSSDLENMTISIAIPPTVELLNLYDENDNPLNYSLASSDAEKAVYLLTIPDLAPNTCFTIKVETELLFCPVNTDFEAQTCITATSGCYTPELSAALMADGDNACTSTENCYDYITEEADIQAEWWIEPMIGQGLCDTLEYAIRIKNVKPAVLLNLDLQWWLPEGLEYIPDSWKVEYPGGTGNGVGNYGALTSIPDPSPIPSQNNAYGIAHYYPDDLLFSSAINADGLPGILVDADSNKVSIRFRAVTTCDAFISGSPLYFNAKASDPCEASVTSGIVKSNPLIIANANPSDFAQFYSYADPEQLYCGATTDLVFRSINISPSGTTNQSRLCLSIPNTEIDYTPNSIYYISPANFDGNPTETTNGGLTTVCMDVPDGIGNGNAISYGFEAALAGMTNCGTSSIGVQISSRIEDQSCTELNVNCDVFVNNSANALIPVQYLPSLPISNFHPVEACADDPFYATYQYSFDATNIANTDYNSTLMIQIIRDINFNNTLEDYEPVLDQNTHNVAITSGGELQISGSLTVPRAQSCPIFFKIIEESACACDENIYYYNGIIPEFFDNLGTQQTLCPDEPLAIAICNDYSYSIAPSSAGVLSFNNTNDSLFLEVLDPDVPVSLSVHTNNGACSKSFSTLIYRLSDDFNIGPYESLRMCSDASAFLDLQLPTEWLANAEVSWSPTSFLDDPSSPTPQVIMPTNDITYIATVRFTNNGVSCIAQASYPIVVEHPSTLNMSLSGDTQCSNPFDPPTLTADAGYDQYTFYEIIDEIEYPFAVGNSNVLVVPHLAGGTFIVRAKSNNNPCADASNTIIVNSDPCYDYGDLPDNGNGVSPNNYETNDANTGPNHIITYGLTLGNMVDYEADGQPSNDALGDGSDEDALAFENTNFRPGMHLQIPLTITNTTGEIAYFEAWIDWNGDGAFDSNEMIANLDDGNGSFPTSLNISVPYDVVHNQALGIRIRLSHTDNMTPYGAIASGEVEDYLIMVGCNDNGCVPLILFPKK